MGRPGRWAKPGSRPSDTGIALLVNTRLGQLHGEIADLGHERFPSRQTFTASMALVPSALTVWPPI